MVSSVVGKATALRFSAASPVMVMALTPAPPRTEFSGRVDAAPDELTETVSKSPEVGDEPWKLTIPVAPDSSITALSAVPVKEVDLMVAVTLPLVLTTDNFVPPGAL